jgi:predicted metalloendopeptidase
MIQRSRLAGCILGVAASFTFSACTTSSSSHSGIDLAGMDRSVAPGDDFFAYANGTWMKSTPIPGDKSYYGIWAVRHDQVRDETRKLIQDSTSNPAAAKIADYYNSFMDEPAVEAKGAEPIRPQLTGIAAIGDRRTLARVIGSRLRTDVDALNATNFYTPNLFGIWITQGLADPAHTYPYLLQGGLGLPDRDYYISAKPEMAKLRDAYRKYIETMLGLAGFADASTRAARVFALETEMAKVHATRLESEDVHAPETWSGSEIPRKAPGLEWKELLDAAGLKDAPTFIAWHPKAIIGISALTASQPLDDWKDWLAFHTVDDAAPFLSKAFVDARFEFRSKTLSGIPEQRPRWQRGIDFTSDDVSELLGRLYAERYFPAASKTRVQTMVANIVKAFSRRIDGHAWMSPETKEKAKQKLVTLKIGVGYPDHWRDYSGLEIVKGDPLGNHLRSTLFDYRYQLAKLGQPPDPNEWWTTPQTVNSFNLPLQNGLNFPAAIIQPPWFDPQADDAYNYGAIGSLIGHEISHSFDNSGAEFDAQGRLTKWWTKADFDHFTAAGEALAKQYDAYRPFPDLAINGHQTLSENIADVAGLLAAYEAYRSSLGGKTDSVKDGLNGDQRFFISFGQSWRAKYREPELRIIVTTDGHSPEEYRADTVRNLDSWYDAFHPTPGQKLFLNPEQRIRVW